MTVDNVSTPDSGDKALSWWKRPLIGFIVGVLGLFIGVAGLIVGIASLKNRELIFYVNPVRTFVVKQGETSKLRVFYGYDEVHGDLVATQIEIWNKGKESIRSVNVLDPLSIRVSSKTPILDAIIKNSTRPQITKIVVDKSFASKGVVTISWNILEEGDGAVLQILYAGNANNAIEVSGVIEGQKGLFQLGDPKRAVDPIKTSNALYQELVQGMWVIIVLAALAVAAIWKLRPPDSGFERFVYWIFFMEILSFAIVMVIYQTRVFSPVPPLSF